GREIRITENRERFHTRIGIVLAIAFQCRLTVCDRFLKLALLDPERRSCNVGLRFAWFQLDSLVEIGERNLLMASFGEMRGSLKIVLRCLRVAGDLTIQFVQTGEPFDLMQVAPSLVDFTEGVVSVAA